MAGNLHGVELDPIHVVIVEDSATDAELMVRTLRRGNLHPYARRVDNETDFLDALEGQPDVIVSDLNLPHFDGREALRLRNERSAAVPFVVVSGVLLGDDEDALLASGATACLVKDSMDGLAALLRDTLALSDTRPHPPDRRRAEIHAQQASEYARSLLEANPDPVVTINDEGKITDVNHAFTAATGRGRVELLSTDFARCFAEPEPALAVCSQALSDGSVSNYPLTLVRVDGGLTDVQCNATLYRDAGGEVLGVIATLRDVTLQKREDANVRALLEGAPDAVVVVDPGGLIRVVNERTEALFGYPREQLLGRPVEMLLPERARSRHASQRRAYSAAPTPRAMGLLLDLSARSSEGREFPVEVSLAPVEMTEGSYVSAAIRDVTQQRRIERIARENATRLQQLADSVHIGFILQQLDPLENLYVSPGCARVLGISLDTFPAAGDAVAGTVSPDDRERLEDGFLADSRAGRAARSEHRIVTPDGQVRWVSVVSTPVPNPQGTPERSVLTFEDISDRIAVAAALEDAEMSARIANAAKNRFLSRMSHELRTPLNAILGFAQLLEFELEGTAQAQNLDQIVTGGKHLLNLINDVLDLARIDAGEMSISPEPVPIAGVIAESRRLMAPMAEAAGVTVLEPISRGDWHVLADRLRLRQMLMNLLSNAIKYNRVGGSVWIEQELRGDRVDIVVRDDGPGISPLLQTRLFTAFDRLGAEATGVDGTGIGLALTRSMAELMGGSLTVESETSRGAAFTIRLPRAEPAAVATGSALSALTSAVPSAETPSAPAKMLLYVEDNEPNVQVVAQLLRLRPRWEMVHAGLGGLGLELARSRMPDLVFLDLHLPDRSGFDVLRALKSDPVTRELPVLVLTADATAGQSRRLLEAGAFRYLTKPLDLNDLLAALDEFDDDASRADAG